MPISPKTKAFGTAIKRLTNQDVANLLSEKNIKLEFPSDTRFAYCNTNYAIIGFDY
jgi:hypothetical protein